jgi:hypothetical protein
MRAPPPREACAGCAHFRNDPRFLESQVPGWTALGSADGSTRAEDGLCGLRGRFVAASQWCPEFRGAQPLP